MKERAGTGRQEVVYIARSLWWGRASLRQATLGFVCTFVLEISRQDRAGQGRTISLNYLLSVCLSVMERMLNSSNFKIMTCPC